MEKLYLFSGRAFSPLSDACCSAAHKHESFIEANRHLAAKVVCRTSGFWQMWLAVLFLIFCAMRELIRVIAEINLSICFSAVESTKTKEEFNETIL